MSLPAALPRTGDRATRAPTALGPYVALAAAGFRRWSTYRQAAAAGVFTNLVFGVIRLSILLAVVVSFGCRFAVNLMAFWLVEIRGVAMLYVLATGVLGGHLVPVHFFPDWLQAVAYATPFPSMIQTPIDLVTGQADGSAAVGLVLAQVGWAVGMLVLGRVVLVRATRKLVLQGG